MSGDCRPYNARNPLYISLFGHDLHATEQYIATVRLLVTELDEGHTAPLAHYRTFIAES